MNSRRDKETALHNYFIQSREQLNKYLEKIDFIAYTAMYSTLMQQLIYKRPTLLSELILYQGNIKRFLNSLSIINNDIDMVLITDQEIITGNDSLVFNSQFDITEQAWFPDFIKNRKYMEYGDYGSRLFIDKRNTWSLTLFYVMTNISTFNIMGYFIVNIPVSKFDFLLNDLQYDWIEVKDSMGNIIINSPSSYFLLAKDPGITEELFKNHGRYDYILYEDTLLDGKWQVKLYRHLSAFSLVEIKNYSLFFILLALILGIFIVSIFSFSRYLTNPIVRCRNAMLEIQKNNFGFTLENHYRDEIGGLIDGFNEMSLTLVSLKQKNMEIEKLRREAEIDTLQQKVNPHFLFNTLEIINALIMDNQHNEAMQVCELLGQIYHYNMMNRKWVSLRDEVEYVKRYVKLLQYKMNDLSVVWEISEPSLKTDILKLILQPLIENAIRHGFRSKPKDACLTISIESLSAGRSEVRIMDNGSGIQKSTLIGIEENLEQIRRGISPGTSHIGIPNVYQRLFLEYGEALDFSIESRPDFGTRITLTIPETIHFTEKHEDTEGNELFININSNPQALSR